MSGPAIAPPARPPLARGPVLSAMATFAVLLAATAGRYGFHRDELYFRGLPPAWGFVDQPPLTPLLARAAAAVSDQVWVMRVPAAVCAVLAVLVVALLARELGGGPGAQGLAAWGFLTGSLPMSFGHVLLTASLDLVVWPLVVLLVVRALLRDPRWWLWVGVVVGLSTLNKLLVVLLVASLGAGLLLGGPWRPWRSPWTWVGVLAALVTAAPALIWQVGHDWPQVTMGRALGRANGAEVRPMVLPFLVLMLGPPLVPVWVAGLVALLRRPAWRPVRSLTPALAVLVLLTLVGGGQVYYPLGLLSAVYAAGCVPAAELLARSIRWRAVAVGGLGLNAVVSAVISLPVLPVGVVGATPVPGINPTVGDTVGWPAYARQVATVYRAAADDDPSTVLVTSNYGEWGALVQDGRALAVPRPYSGHNQLWWEGSPPPDTRTVVVVGDQLDRVRELFGTCRVAARLDDGVGVDNEEQGAPVAVCSDPVASWTLLWPRFRHLD